MEPVECKVSVVSGGKQSETHRFTYLPEIVTGKRKIIPILPQCLLGFSILLGGNGRRLILRNVPRDNNNFVSLLLLYLSMKTRYLFLYYHLYILPRRS